MHQMVHLYGMNGYAITVDQDLRLIMMIMIIAQIVDSI